MDLVCTETRRRIESHLACVLDRVFSTQPRNRVRLEAPEAIEGAADACGLTPLNAAICRFVLAGGKRVRPQLCVWTYQEGSGFGIQGSGGRGQAPNGRRHGPEQAIRVGAKELLAAASTSSLNSEPRTLNPSADPEPATTSAVLDVACAWEMFHAFLLCHDDIIDAADMRRDAPSLHRQLASLDGGSETFGMNLAIVAGDLLFAATMRVLHELDLPADAYRRVLRLFSRVACTTGLGQAVDICQSHAPVEAACEQALLREYHWKTAAYTFEGPMLTGAVLAGLDEAAQASLSRFALALGQAYQLQNDLIDLATAAHEGCDLVQGKRTVTLLRARSAMGERQRREFDRRLVALRSANGHAVAMAESLRREVLDTGAAERTREVIADFLGDARAAARDAALPPGLAQGLGGMLEALEANYFRPG